MQLVASGIDKHYGNTHALSGVSINLVAGEVHALVGENGAGKSTLLKVLGGVERPTHGTMEFDGRPYAPRTTRDAESCGIAMVFQEVTINPSLTVSENIYIDRLRDFTRYGILDRAKLDREAQEVLDSFSVDINVRSDIASLDHGKWKCIEIARALSIRPKFLFLDEATAFLNHEEVDAVLASIRALKLSGLTVAFVSHHLSEVSEVADRLTILKDGQWVGTFVTGELSSDEIQTRMVGRDLAGRLFPERKAPSKKATALKLEHVSSGQQLRDISINICTGEILGVAGLKGSGGEGLLEAIVGDHGLNNGAMKLDGEPYCPAQPAQAWACGVAYVPGDRTGEGLIAEFSITDNLMMARPPRKWFFFDSKNAFALAADLVSQLRIKTASMSAPCKSLSGGNLQKVVLGKCIAVHPRVLLLNNPTRGVDIGARFEIYRVIRVLANEGLAVVIVSDDLQELIGLSDRLIVMRRGEIRYEFPVDQTPTEDLVVRYMA
jgi:ABC-type sugar transport system ATPase subunit